MASPADHVLAIDVGTSTVRVSAVALDGETLATERVASRARIQGVEATLEVDELWADLAALIRAVAARTGPPLAIGISAQLATVVLDEGLQPLEPAFLWSDRRATAEAEELARTVDAELLATAGRRPAAEQAAARFAWLGRHRPVSAARMRWLATLKDVLVARLTGELMTDPSSASYSLLLDVERRSWSAGLADAVGIGLDRLPPIRSGDAGAGQLQPPAAELLGLPGRVAGRRWRT